MVKLNNKWEELRSALNYYKYITVSDEEDVIYQTLDTLSVIQNDEYIRLVRGVFQSRCIDLWGAEKVERLHFDVPYDGNTCDMEIFKLYTPSDTLTISLWGYKDRDKLIPLSGEVTEHSFINPLGWDKDMCYYNPETDTAAIGIDVFAYNYTMCRKRLNDPIDPNHKEVYGLKQFFNPITRKNKNIISYAGSNTIIPAFIVEGYSDELVREYPKLIESGNNIFIDAICAETGERLTYHAIAPKLTATETEIIHTFVTDMKAAYKRLTEPYRNRAADYYV